MKKGIFLQEKAEGMAQERDRAAAFSNVHRAVPLLHRKFQFLQTAPEYQEAFPAGFIRRESEAAAGAVHAVRNPPAFPPFLPVMKTRGEDIRPSISRQSASHVFR